jgi:colanic acid biosynthesis glycosyl transferase WcaI
VTFFFIGDGIRRKELFREWNCKVPSNTKVLPYQPKEKIGESIAGCHVALISLRTGLQGMAVPCKIYGILAAGIPVVAMVPENSEIGLIIREENCGFVINPNDLDGLVNAILKLKSDEKLRTAMGKNGRKAFEQKYLTRIIAEKYKSLIQS